MLIAHLTDLHVTRPDATIAEFANGADAVKAAVAHLNGLDRQVDAVILTGDLVNDGTVEEYELLRALLDPLASPYYLLLGNHDGPAAVREVFPEHDYLPADRPGHWVLERHELRVVAVDTTIAGRHDGELTPAKLAWLQATLAAEPDAPTLVCMHHPPFLTGMWWMDYGGVGGVDAFRDLICANPQVVGVIAGHVHHGFHATIGSALVSSAPALTYQSCLALSANSPPLVSDVVAPIPLLWWTGDQLLATHTDYRLPQQTLDLRHVIPDWDTYERRCRAGGPIPADH